MHRNTDVDGNYICIKLYHLLSSAGRRRV